MIQGRLFRCTASACTRQLTRKLYEALEAKAAARSSPKPFVWRADSLDVLAAVERGKLIDNAIDAMNSSPTCRAA
jgi:hypothetical protein